MERLGLGAVLLWCVVTLGGKVGASCVGDCNGDGTVTIDEIVRGVNLALGNASIAACPSFDRDRDGSVAVDEIIAAVNALLSGCEGGGTPTASPSSSVTSSPTPTPTATPSFTATRRPNRAPTLAPAIWYRAYADFPIALPLGVSDPDGDLVHCTASNLPTGAELDDATWTIRWTPQVTDLGNHELLVECRDDAEPPATAVSQVVFTVYGSDACSIPACDPSTGCSRALASLEAPCCSGQAVVTPPVPNLPCPAGRMVWISEDIDGGFRPLSDCDLKYVRNNAQSSAEVRFKFRGRCFSLDDRIVVSARMETRERTPVIDGRYRVQFYEAGQDLVESRSVPFEVLPPRPFFDMQDAEANLVVTLTDGQLQTHTQSLRLRLTFTPVPEP